MTTHQPATRRMLAPVAVATALLGLLLALALVPVSPAGAAKDRPFAEFAKTFRGDGTLKKGCKDYSYRHKITPPEDADTWALEIFIVDGSGETVASDAVIKGADPKKGTRQFRLCRARTEPGKFRLRGKFTYKVGFDTFDGQIDPTRFSLRLR